MNDLQQAYFDLGLKSGSSLEAILLRYKRLIMVWHPDRMNNDDGRKVADEEMKKINNAKDVLKSHFESGEHRETGTCACRSGAGQQAAGASPSGHGGPGPGPRRTRNTEEQQREDEAARTRDDERRQRTEEEARQRAAEQAEQAAQAAHEKAVATAFRDENDRKLDSLRWKLSIGCGVAFVLIGLVPIVSDALLKPVISGEDLVLKHRPDEAQSKQVNDGWQAYLNDKQYVATSVLKTQASNFDVSAWAPPFISSDRGADYLSQDAYRQLVGKPQEEQKQHDQDVYNARMDVDRYQNTIAECQKRIAEAQAKVDNPNYAILDQKYAASDVARFQRLLNEAQEGFQYSQKRLDALQSGTLRRD